MEVDLVSPVSPYPSSAPSRRLPASEVSAVRRKAAIISSQRRRVIAGDDVRALREAYLILDRLNQKYRLSESLEEDSP